MKTNLSGIRGDKFKVIALRHIQTVTLKGRQASPFLQIASYIFQNKWIQAPPMSPGSSVQMQRDSLLSPFMLHENRATGQLW